MTTRSRGHEVTRSRGHEVTRSRGHEVTRSRGHEVTRTRGHEVTRSRGHEVTRSRGHEVTRSRGHEVTRSRGHEVTRSRGHEVTRSRGHEVTRSRGHVRGGISPFPCRHPLHTSRLRAGYLPSAVKSTISRIEKQGQLWPISNLLRFSFVLFSLVYFGNDGDNTYCVRVDCQSLFSVGFPIVGFHRLQSPLPPWREEAIGCTELTSRAEGTGW